MISVSYNVVFLFKEYETLTFAKIHKLKQIAVHHFGWDFDIKKANPPYIPEEYLDMHVVKYEASETFDNEASADVFTESSEETSNEIIEEVNRVLGKERENLKIIIRY